MFIAEKRAAAQVCAEGLPDFCYVSLVGLESGGRIGLVRRGCDGYWHAANCDHPSLGAKQVAALVRRLNERLGVGIDQEQAMLTGSMFGWHVPGADPKSYTKRASRRTPSQQWK